MTGRAAPEWRPAGTAVRPVRRSGRDGGNSGAEREVVAHTRTGRLTSIRLRLMLPIAIASVGLLVLGLIQTRGAVRSALDARRAQVMANLDTATVRLSREIEREIAESDALHDRNGMGASLLTAAIGQTDLALGNYRTASTAARTAAPALAGVLDGADQELATLVVIRNDVNRLAVDQLSGDRYERLSESLITVADALPGQLTDPQLAASGRAVAAIVAASHLGAEQRDLLRSVFRRSAFGAGEYADLSHINGELDARIAEFSRNADADQQAGYNRMLSGTDVINAQRLLDAVLAPNAGPISLKADPDGWYIAQSNMLRRLNTVELSLSHDLDQTSRVQGANAQNLAFATAGLAAGLILLVFAVALTLAMRISRRLRKLRRAALSVAHAELPGAIASLSRAPEAGQVRSALTDSLSKADSHAVQGADEIGEVGSALGTVHRQALRLAADQALLRLDVSGLFIALSRRGQSLIRRQLELIDQFEDAETDPGRLSRLFQLDHLAARMRRNEENLLVLAGGEPGRRVVEPVSLAELVQAAASEIEDYERIDAVGVTDVGIVAQVVRDMIHVLAELFENATGYSPPHTRVRISARRAVDGVALTVFDEGIGMPAAQVAELNGRLRRPTMLTAELAGTMGLLVVARLAQRNGIVVELRSSLGGGTAALVSIPTTLLAPVPITASPLDVTRPALSATSDHRYSDQDYRGRRAAPVQASPAPVSGAPLGAVASVAPPPGGAHAWRDPNPPPAVERGGFGPGSVVPASGGHAPAGSPGGYVSPSPAHSGYAPVPGPDAWPPKGPGAMPANGVPFVGASGVPVPAPAVYGIPASPTDRTAPRPASGQAGQDLAGPPSVPPAGPAPRQANPGPGALPRRRPGGLLLSGSAAATPTQSPGGRDANLPPDPDAVRARLSGLANGLAAGARRPEAPTSKQGAP